MVMPYPECIMHYLYHLAMLLIGFNLSLELLLCT